MFDSSNFCGFRKTVIHLNAIQCRGGIAKEDYLNNTMQPLQNSFKESELNVHKNIQPQMRTQTQQEMDDH